MNENTRAHRADAGHAAAATNGTNNHWDVSPYMAFERADWANLRAETPLTLTEADLKELQGLNESVSMAEVEEIYLPLSRLLNLYVGATQELYRVTSTFLGRRAQKVPFIIAMVGSVAVGKSTTARILQALLARWPHHPKVDLVPTDGFLFPNAVLAEKGLMERKGFPESYDQAAMIRFLHKVKSGQPASAPVYSHLTYDIVPEAEVTVERPDVLIVEGLNLLQTGAVPGDHKPRIFASDFFDFSVYVDAHPPAVKKWYVERFLTLRDTAFRDERSYFHRYAGLDDDAAVATATDIWDRINGRNLEENIRPTRTRADLILHKSEDHSVQKVFLKKI